MTHSHYGPDQPEYQPPPPEAFHPDVYLPHPYPQPPARKGGHGKKIIAGVALAAVVAGGAVAAYAYTVLASSGIQPERVLPANTVAFAKLDLDPAAGQKIAAYRLSTKFPAVSKGAADMDDAKDAILSEFFDEQSELDYTTEIKPWLGDRIAIAAVPNSASEAGLDPVLVVAYTDEAKMKAAFSKAARTEHDFGYVTIDGYALVSDSQSHAEAVLAGVRRGTLAGAEHYRADLKALDGDQLAVGWADIEAVVTALKAGDRSGANSRLEGIDRLDTLAAAKSRMIVGAHASSDYLEVSAISRQKVVDGAPRLAGKPVNGTLAKLAAADTTAALEISGLGEAFKQVWAGASTALGMGGDFEDFVEESGLQLPDDLVALFGSDATVSLRLPQGASGDPQIAAQVTTDDPDRALEVLDSLGLPFGFAPDSLHTQKTADGYLLSNSASYDPRAPAGVPTLGADPAFQKAVPDRANAGLIGYLNLGGMLDADEHASAKDKADWKHVGSLGLSVVPTSDGSRINFRLTTR
ncbi:MAG: DUF3352 domain-containing protein [Jatrophihabitantaceae bacterium]